MVAAIRYISNGFMLTKIREMYEETATVAAANSSLFTLHSSLQKVIALYEDALNTAKALDNQEAFDFLARRLYDMTAELVMSLLIIRDAAARPDLFLKSANVYVRMAEEDITGKAAYIKAFTPDALCSFRAVEQEA